MASEQYVSVTTMPPNKRFQYNMIQVHKILKMGYDIIVSHLDNPPTDDLANFLGYCQSWADTIDNHHNSEEEVVFPFLNQKLDFSGEQAAHVVIHTHLDAILASIRAAQADHSKFDPPALKAAMEEFKVPLFAHLDEEIVHIGPANVGVFDDASLLKVDADLDKYAQNHGDPYVIVPFIMSHVPPELKPTWPPVPWLVRKVLVPYMFARRYAGYWKYAPYATS